ncbi:hypothetical protein R1sor_000549 [Riccia sorocarpa]|uniref:Coiled-coil domain-containing protein 22 homolog n=1 Tax=Riccia sorocarpa TaxID=122646 RepID=A0ABD3GVT7_9MARC
MDDAQGIVLLALQRAGVELPEDIHSVGDLRPKQLLPIYGQALALLRGSPQPDLPTEFPQQRAERFRLCADLVAAFQQLGYRGELSFHQFLYPSEADTHRLLRFLLDKLSQTTSAAGRGRGARRARVAGRIDDFGGSKISGTVRHALTVCWDEANASASLSSGKEVSGEAPSTGFRSELERRPSTSVDGVEKVIEWGVPFRVFPLRLASQRSKKQPPLLTLQAKPRSWLVPSVLELNARNAEKSARLADAQLADLARHADKSVPVKTDKKVITQGKLLASGEVEVNDNRLVKEVSLENSSSADQEQRLPESAEAKQRADVSRLEKQLSTLTEEAGKVKKEVDELEATALKLEKKVKDTTEKADALEERRLLMTTAVRLALDESRPPEEVVQELELVVKEGDERLLALQSEWDAVRTRLEEKTAEAEKSFEARNSEVHNKLRQIREMRQEVKDMSAKLWAREAEEAQLSADVEKLAKGATRATYVRRITELVRNSKKQDADIARIILDTRELQRESNMSQDKLRRLHALVDEIVFRDAKKDPICRQAYKLLSGIHTNFESVVEKVLEMDKLGREITELQVKLEELEKRPLDAASVEADLEAIVAENRALERRLAELGASSSKA